MIFQHTELRGLTSVFGMGIDISPRVRHKSAGQRKGQSIGSGPDGLILMLVILPSGGEEDWRVAASRMARAFGHGRHLHLLGGEALSGITEELPRLQEGQVSHQLGHLATA